MTIHPAITKNSKGMYTAQDSLVTKENRAEIIQETTKRGFKELAKTIGHIGLLILIGAVIVALTFVITELAAAAFTFLILPLAAVPPLYAAIFEITSVTALATASGTVATGALNKLFGNAIIQNIKKHASRSIHLFKEAKRIRNLEIHPQEEPTILQRFWDSCYSRVAS